MKTVWIKNDEPWAAKFSDADFVNYKADKLASFLKEINEFQTTGFISINRPTTSTSTVPFSAF